MRRRILCTVVFLLGLWPAHLSANDANDCEQIYTPERTIRGCTAVLRAGGLFGTDLARIYTNRGLGYAAQGALELAIVDYDSAIKADPDYPWAYNGRGRAYVELGEYQRAIGDFNQVIRRIPGTVAVSFTYRERGFARCALGRQETAVADLTQAMTLGSLSPWSLQERLSQAEYYDGPTDGELSVAFLTAVRAWVGDGCPE